MGRPADGVRVLLVQSSRDRPDRTPAPGEPLSEPSRHRFHDTRCGLWKPGTFPPGREAEAVGKAHQPPVGIPALAGGAVDPPLTGAVHGAIPPEADCSGSISLNSPPLAPALAFGSRSLTGAGACVGLGR